MIGHVGHNNHATGRHHGNSIWLVEACVCARSISIGCISASRKRCDVANRRYEPDAMVAVVCYDDNATRRHHCDSDRAKEACYRTCAIGEGSGPATSERAYITNGRNDADAVVICVRHNNCATGGNYCHSKWVVEARNGSCSVGKVLASTSSKRARNTEKCHKAYAIVVCVSHDNSATGGHNRYSEWLIETRGRTNGVNEGGASATCKSRHKAAIRRW
jgi:hypothetical protein